MASEIRHNNIEEVRQAREEYRTSPTEDLQWRAQASAGESPLVRLEGNDRVEHTVTGHDTVHVPLWSEGHYPFRPDDPLQEMAFNASDYTGRVVLGRQVEFAEDVGIPEVRIIPDVPDLAPDNPDQLGLRPQNREVLGGRPLEIGIPEAEAANGLTIADPARVAELLAQDGVFDPTELRRGL